jgi:hypothetical protein
LTAMPAMANRVCMRSTLPRRVDHRQLFLDAENRRVSPQTTAAVAIVAIRCFKVCPLTNPGVHSYGSSGIGPNQFSEDMSMPNTLTERKAAKT